MYAFKTCSLLVVASMCGFASHAATVTYGNAFNIGHLGTTNILNGFDASRNGGVSFTGLTNIVEAISYGRAAPAGGPTINGVSFTEVGGSTDFWGDTGINPQIDDLLSGHTASGGGLFTLTLDDLTVGQLYQIQLIGIHDSRTVAGINQRQQEVSFGGSDFTSQGAAPVLTRFAYGNDFDLDGGSFDGIPSFGSVVGTFVADSSVQTIQFRSNQQDGNFNDDPDPGLSGYVLITTPEPTSMIAGALGLGGLMARRRRG